MSGIQSTIKILSNLTATVAPTVNDDNTKGYSVGSTWIDVTGKKVYTCIDSSVGVAVWNSGSVQNSFDKTVDPTSTDDSSLGYEVGSVWINVTANTIFTCVDATASAAIWSQEGDAIPTSEKGVANGVSTLDATGNVPGSQLGNVVGIPFGSIMPIASNLPGTHTIPASGIVDSNGWMYCDGSVIPGGNTVGGSTPNLTNGRFLRGSTSSGATGGSDSLTIAITNMPSHTHVGASHTHTIAHTHSTPAHTHTASSNSTGAHTHTVSAYVNTEQALGGGTAAGSVSGVKTTSSAGTHSHTITVNSGGSGTTGSSSAASSGAASATTTGSTGSGTALTHIPLYMTVQYLIKVS